VPFFVENKLPSEELTEQFDLCWAILILNEFSLKVIWILWNGLALNFTTIF
jgi:hypothetical protein